MRVFGQDPKASLHAVAAAASISRQTVYAHYAGRTELLEAVLDRVTEESVAALDAAELDEGPAAEALLRFVDASWDVIDRYPFLLQPGIAEEGPHQSRDRHEPVLARLHHLIARGHASGEFDRTAPASWLAAVTVALGHAAGQERGAGRMSRAQAITHMHTSLLRVYGVSRP
jgi:AcrR family transcriptional regulator